MTQVVVRLSDELAAALDALVESGIVESRSAAIRDALRAFVDDHRRAEISRRIVDGYRRIPPDDDLEAWAIAAGRALVEAEPW